MKKLLAPLALVLLVTPALAGDEAAERPAIVDYRHNQMELAGKHMKLSKMIIKGEINRPQDMVQHAEGLHNISLGFTELFPEGTGPDKVKTEALPSVWTNFKGFEKANKAFADATEKLVKVAKSGDVEAFKKQFGEVGASCGGCHDDFRQDDD